MDLAIINLPGDATNHISTPEELAAFVKANPGQITWLHSDDPKFMFGFQADRVVQPPPPIVPTYKSIAHATDAVQRGELLADRLLLVETYYDGIGSVLKNRIFLHTKHGKFVLIEAEDAQSIAQKEEA